jgi:hypothetical protein
MLGTNIFEARSRADIAGLGSSAAREIPVLSKTIETSSGEAELEIYWVQSEDLHSSACGLINKRYAWRGYGDSHVVKRSSAHTTFSAVVNDAVVGTVTLAVDSDTGLAADAVFKQELDSYRSAPRAYVCELTKLAADSDLQSPAILAALFHVILLYGQLKYSCTDLFIEVNPRHRRFYEAMLGFERIGDVKTNDSVDAPAQLMHLAVDRIRPMIEAYRDADPAASTRSLYPHFLPQRDEEMVLLRLFTLLGRSAQTGVGVNVKAA